MWEPVNLTDDTKQRTQKSQEIIKQQPNPKANYRNETMNKNITGSYTGVNPVFVSFLYYFLVTIELSKISSFC